MVKKILKISLLVILSVSVLGFAVKKKSNFQNRNVNTDSKIGLINKLDQQNTLRERQMPRRTAVIDVSNITASRGNVKTGDNTIERQGKFEAAMPIADYYGDAAVQGDNLASLQKVMGVSIGTSTLTFATAYQGRNIAVGSDGAIHVVYSEAGTPSNVTMYAKSTDNGATWTTPAVINDGYYGYKPAIDVDPTNPLKIHVVYIGYMNQNETRTARYIKSVDGGNTWSASVLIAGSQVNTNNPDIVVDSNGNPHVAFDSYSDSFIRYNYSSDGGTTWFTEPEIVNTGFGGQSFGAAIAIDKNGNPHVLFGGDGAANTWGDKNTYWNWRDMTAGAWQEVPPVALSTDEVGCPYPSMVFDSNGIGHLFFDAAGSTGNRGVWYRQYNPEVGWGDPVEFPSSSPGGSTMMAQAGIDDQDHLFVGYLDGLGGGMSLEPSEGDFFVGTNISGEWQYTNVSGNGPAVYESHPNVARRVSSADSLFHCVYELGGGPVDIAYELGYPWPPNPKCAVNQLPDTYDTTGPFSVTATTSDLDGTVEGCSLFVWVNETSAGSYQMLSTAPNVWEADFTIDGEVGDVISYTAKAVDNDGLEGESFLTLFDVMEPTNPGADILLVGDDMRILDVYTNVLDELGYIYEYWDIDLRGGIDESVTNFGWNNIILGGWAITSLPTRDYTDDPYAAFLNDGGNLVLFSQDWFWSLGEPAYAVTFEPGDFAYDYFQIGSGSNDPDEKDSLIIGIESDTISGNWAVNPIEFNIALFESNQAQTGTNWMDWTTATGNGVDIFYAYNQGFGTGVRHDGGTYKTIYLPFMYEWMIDSTEAGVVGNEDAIQLMDNILTWFGAMAPPTLEEVTGPRYGVYGYGPFDVSAQAEDLRKVSTVESMQVGYMVDDDADWTWLDLTTSNGTYTGQIPQLAPEDTFVVYKFKAVDNDGLSGLSDVYQFWTTGLTYTQGINLLYCGDDYYIRNNYYNLSTEPVDSIVTDALDALGVSYDYWDVDEFGAPDYQTVLSNYASVIWHGYGDWDPAVFPIYSADNPFYCYLMDGGNLLWSSEEMLGTWYDWPPVTEGYSPGPGESAYDILNIGWLACDLNYDTLRIIDSQEPLDADLDSILTLEALPFGYMGDLADPVNSANLANTAYAFDAYLDGPGVWYGPAAWHGNIMYGMAWRYIDPDYGYRTITLPFCIANLDSANRSAFLKNALDWFASTSKVDKPQVDLPKTFALYNNRPNPFNPETVIAYDLPKIAQVELVVYNIMGQKIKTLFNGQRNAGRFDVVWDGTNDAGMQVASGVYIFTIKAGDFIQSNKMMLLR